MSLDTLQSAAASIVRWRRDPVAMVRELFRAEPDPWQRKGLIAFADPRQQRIAFKANKGPGKTTELAWMIWNFLLCHGSRDDHPKGAATSVTKDNIKANLWPELSKWQQRSPLLQQAFEWTSTRIKSRDHPETWWFDQRTWSKSADSQQQSETLAGLHALDLLFVIDESGGVPSSIMATAEAGLATIGGFKKIVQSGNPTHLEGPLWDACSTHRDLWSVFEITGDPDDPDRSPRISVEWAKQQIRLYGRDNPWVLVNVFGKFPPGSINAVFGPDEVQEAMKRTLTKDAFDWAQRRMGVDVARFGDDRSVIAARQGLNARYTPIVLQGMRTTDIAGRVQVARRKFVAERIFVDDTGHWGHGVIDNLIAAGHPAVGIQFHGSAFDKRYKNRRAEMWLEWKEWLDRGGILPNIPELSVEMCAATYTFANGVFQLEDKDLIKAKIGRSPDLADAFALTFAEPELPTMEGLPLGFPTHGTLESEYDPQEYAERMQ